jgi:hypothetical protein
VKFLTNIALIFVVFLGMISCKKDKFTNDPSATIHFSQDSVLFDTVFTTIGSSTRNIRIVNNNNQKIRISSLQLQSGGASGFKLNVDGVPGTSFSDLEIAAHDSMYIFIQVNVNPTNQNSPLIISDKINATVNGNSQSVYLEAWGQDAYYHRPTNAIKFKDGSYLPYSTVSPVTTATTVIWPNDKPHVIYGYLVVDSAQKLIVNAGTRVYLNYKAGLWVYKYGEIHVPGQLGNEVSFQGARREADYADEPGQWDRIWINEGSNNNEINYALIKNGFIGIQTEPLDTIGGVGRLKLTNTKIQNMSKWGLYSIGYKIYGANNVISNCQEHSLNIQLGGTYTFLHCTFANFWGKPDPRSKPAVNISNYAASQVFPMDSAYFGNCTIDGTLSNELSLDLDYTNSSFPPKHKFSSSWIKTDINTSDATKFIDIRTSTTNTLNYVSPGTYNFEPVASETQHRNFSGPNASADALKVPIDISGGARNTSAGSVSAGAYK